MGQTDHEYLYAPVLVTRLHGTLQLSLDLSDPNRRGFDRAYLWDRIFISLLAHYCLISLAHLTNICIWKHVLLVLRPPSSVGLLYWICWYVSCWLFPALCGVLIGLIGIDKVDHVFSRSATRGSDLTTTSHQDCARSATNRWSQWFWQFVEPVNI